MTNTRFIRPSDKVLSSGALYAIIKDGSHIGNCRGRNSLEAIQVYLFDSLYGEFIMDEETLSHFVAIDAVEGIHFGSQSESLANSSDLQRLQQMKNPLRFIHLNDLVLGEFGITYRLNDGFDINDLLQVSMKEQLLFQKMVSRNQQLNLMMVDSIFPLMMAEMATVVLLKGPMTCKQYVQTGNSVYGEFLMTHKLHQFIHHLLYADIADERPFSGKLDYERVYYRKGLNEEIEYFPVFEQQKLQTLLYNNGIMEIDLGKSILTEEEVALVLHVGMDSKVPAAEEGNA